MPLLAGVGILSALGALFQSKEKMFLWGAGVLAAIKPFTQLFIQKTNNRLNQILKDAGQAEELEAPVKEEAKDKMK